MGIKKRVEEALNKLSMGDYENALVQALIALDATAKKEGLGKKNSERCKKFIDRNRALITCVSFEGTLTIEARLYFGIKDSSGNLKPITFEEALYKLVRCSLLHEGELSQEVEFTKWDDIKLGSGGEGKIVLPQTMVFGIVMAVVASLENKNVRIGEAYSFDLGNKRFYINDFWGKKDKILEVFRKHANEENPKRSGSKKG